MNFQHLWLKNNDVPDALFSAMVDLQSVHTLYRSPFFRPEFIRVMAQVRQDVHLFWNEDEQGLNFYWALHLNKSRHARGIGGPFSDRNGPVARDGFSFDIPDFLTSAKIKKLTTNGLISVTEKNALGLNTELNNEAFINTPYDEFYEVIRSENASFHKRLRRYQRNLESDFGPIEFIFNDTSPEAVRWLMDIKSQQYLSTGRHDVLGPQWVKHMFALLADHKEAEFGLCVSTLKADGQYVAAEMNLRSASTLHGWIVGYNPDYGKYSPGNLIVMKILSELRNHKLSYYDFGPGGDEYKKYFINHREPLGVGSLYAPNAPHLLETVWSQAEENTPEKISELLQKTRRRTDQILATEIDFVPRVKGFIRALQTSL